MGQSDPCVGPQDRLGTRAAQAHVGSGGSWQCPHVPSAQFTVGRLAGPLGAGFAEGAGVSVSEQQGDPRLCSPAACKPLM